MALGARVHAIGNLLTAVAVFAGFLFALMLQLLDAAVDGSGQSEKPARAGRRVRFLREVTANVTYAALVAVVIVVLLGGAELTTSPGPSGQPAWFSLIVFAALLHLVVTVLMVLKRAYGVTHRELDYAATNDDAS